jgi:hypothetical protein
MGREERLIYARVMRLQGRDGARVLRRPLKGEMVNNKIERRMRGGVEGDKRLSNSRDVPLSRCRLWSKIRIGPS